MHALTALDIIVILLVGGGGVLGGFRGFVTEVLSLFAWIAVVLALRIGHGPVSAALEGPVDTASGAAVLAFALIAGIVFIGGRMVARAIGARTRQSILGPLDRVLGVGFGALKGLVGASLLFLAANLAYDTVFGGAAARPEWMARSRSYPLLEASGRAIVDFVATRRGNHPSARPRDAGSAETG
jgi:membrane protein required for colicin V production